MKRESRTSLLVMIIGVVVCLACRIYQIVGCTDMTTGFLYYEYGIFADLVYYLPLALVFAVMIVAADHDRKHGRLSGEGVSDIVDAKAGVIGFGMLLTGMGAAFSGLEKMNSSYASGFSTYVDFIGGAAMIVIAFVTLYKKEFSPGLGFSYAVGAIYFTLRGVLVFLERMVIVTVPEYLLNCLTAIFAGMFFMLFTKLFSGNGQKRTRASLCVFGGLTAVLSISSALAVIISKFTAPSAVADRITMTRQSAFIYYQSNGGRDAYLMTFVPWVDLAVGLLAAAVVIALVVGERKKPQEIEPSNG
ncbi:MAG: hypothetical protein ACI4Q4_04540 [Oscillospiraceae bacterium]